MLAENYITSSCKIDGGAVFKDGQRIFENKGVEVNDFLLLIYQHFHLNYPKFYKMDNLSKLGWLASEILIKDSFKKDNYQPEVVGVVLANSNSSLDDDIKYFDSVKDIASPSLFVYTLPNIVIGEICIRNHFKGEHAFFIQDNFDATFIVQQVKYLLDNNILKACICGWVDVLEQDYKASLFLVEKQKSENLLSFLAENMDNIFKDS
ncbi:hypothetical protein ACPPVU_02900 [Mucilaginibacter sp. McL0603]|uniref:hypothetical protein n=1 Tax=Mucilaginibacter sp. McL0603 TaxID=3415670 RepID=UPI003CE685FE